MYAHPRVPGEISPVCRCDFAVDCFDSGQAHYLGVPVLILRAATNATHAIHVWIHACTWRMAGGKQTEQTDSGRKSISDRIVRNTALQRELKMKAKALKADRKGNPFDFHI